MSLISHNCTCEVCVVDSKQTKFTVYGDKTCYEINNERKIALTKRAIDSCVLRTKSELEKCDYLFMYENLNCFVELKGSDVEKAIRQIVSTISYLKDRITGDIKARIVCSRFKKAPDVKSSRGYQQLMKMTKRDFLIRNVYLKESI